MVIEINPEELLAVPAVVALVAAIARGIPPLRTMAWAKVWLTLGVAAALVFFVLGVTRESTIKAALLWLAAMGLWSGGKGALVEPLL